MTKFFEQLYALLLEHFSQVEIVDAGRTTKQDSDGGLSFEGAQAVYEVDLGFDDMSQHEMENIIHGVLYSQIQGLMRKHLYIESFEVTTRRNMLIVSLYYKTKRKMRASAVDLYRSGWGDGKVFTDLQSGLETLASDLFLLNRTLPPIRSYDPNEGSANIPLKTIEGSYKAETITLTWKTNVRSRVILRVDRVK